MKVWVDCTAAAHPLVLRPIIERLEAAGHEVEVTARDYGQTEGILERLGHPVHERRRARRRLDARQGPRRSRGAARRLWRWAGGAGLRPRARPRLGGHRGRSRGRSAIPLVQMNDYEHAGLQRRISFRGARLVLAPDAIPVEAMEQAGARRERLFRYPGLKEDYYLADFEPDDAVLAELGLDRERLLVVVRPPPETSEYHAENPLYEGVIERLAGRRRRSRS